LYHANKLGADRGLIKQAAGVEREKFLPDRASSMCQVLVAPNRDGMASPVLDLEVDHNNAVRGITRMGAGEGEVQRAATSIVVNDVSKLGFIFGDAMAAEYAPVRIRIRDYRVNVHAMAKAERELIGCRPRLLHAKGHERRRPGILVQCRIQAPAPSRCF